MMSKPTSARGPFERVEDVQRLVEQFKSTRLPHAEWNHRAHVTVAGWYLLRNGLETATERFIAGVKRYNAAHAVAVSRRGGFHLTLTLFWVAMIRATLDRNDQGSTLARINRLVASLATETRRFGRYYSAERLWSDRARHTWVEPDLQPLPADVGRVAEAWAREPFSSRAADADAPGRQARAGRPRRLTAP